MRIRILWFGAFFAISGCVEEKSTAFQYVVSTDGLDLGSTRYDQSDFPVATFSILNQDTRTLRVTPSGFTGAGAGYLTQDLDNFSELGTDDTLDINVGLVDDPLLWDSGSFEATFKLEISGEDSDGSWLYEDQSVLVTLTLLCDLDGDGADGDTTGGADCDDGHAGIGPDATEICDGVDDDCDGLEDEDDAADALTWYLDSDGDRYGDRTASAPACEQPDGYVSNDTDCDDGDEDINPGAEEECNFVDDDCDAQIDEDDVCE